MDEIIPTRNYLTKESAKERGVLLTLWLSLTLALNVIAVGIFFFFAPLVAQALPNISEWTSYLFGALSIANIIFVYTLFLWKKWSLYGYVITSIIGVIINFFIGVNIVLNIAGFGVIVIFYLFVKTKWELFE